MTFIDDYSRFTRVCLLRNKDEAFHMFLKYKDELEINLIGKSKGLDLIEGDNTSF